MVSRSGISSVEYRVDGGDWMSVSQEFGMEMAPLKDGIGV